MKTKLLTGLLTSFLTLLVILGTFPVCADSAEYTVGEVERLADGIVAYKLEEAGADFTINSIDELRGIVEMNE